ncbi:MAG: glycoside hydrolase family 43 protein [Planctomycetes bacterium]|nr:glycoside hydrolase family 43 protein [Planctomycetota bacterium]
MSEMTGGRDPRRAATFGAILCLAAAAGLAAPSPPEADRPSDPPAVRPTDPSAARVADPSASRPAGFLFAHMMANDYGRLYYAISEDGLHWVRMNGGRRILEAYRGHPDICRGHDGRFYLIGNEAEERDIHIWVSDDLAAWRRFGRFAPDVFATPGFTPAHDYKGAPKIYYDSPAGIYLITWHTTDRKRDRIDTEWFWSGMRTLYVTSKDLRDFSTPKRLFDFDIATIDAIVRPEGSRYYAIIKDERYPSFERPTGKTIRIARADRLLGPYGEPGRPIATNFREAPALISRPDGRGWYLYYEQYPGVSYGLSTAPSLEGPWHEVYWEDFRVPPGARHGCMMAIGEAELSAIRAAYGKS